MDARKVNLTDFVEKGSCVVKRKGNAGMLILILSQSRLNASHNLSKNQHRSSGKYTHNPFPIIVKTSSDRPKYPKPYIKTEFEDIR